MPGSVRKKSSDVNIRDMLICPYEPVWEAMQTYTQNRDSTSPDMVWRLQHTPIYTLGFNAAATHLLHPTDIPVVKIDRGGQITYHGPGQLVIYLLLDLKRRNLGIKDLVRRIEQSVVNLLDQYGVQGHILAGKPGVYVNQRKIAALGLRVRKNGCYHGLSLNVNMDLTPFENINPCGYPGLKVTQLIDLGINIELEQVSEDLTTLLLKELCP